MGPRLQIFSVRAETERAGTPTELLSTATIEDTVSARQEFRGNDEKILNSHRLLKLSHSLSSARYAGISIINK